MEAKAAQVIHGLESQWLDTEPHCHQCVNVCEQRLQYTDEL